NRIVVVNVYLTFSITSTAWQDSQKKLTIGVVSSYAAQLTGFPVLKDNVAMNKCARHCLWILGNERTLTNSESVWKDLVSDARNRHCFFDAEADECLKMMIIGTKKELEQLDDLVNRNVYSLNMQNGRFIGCSSSDVFQRIAWKVSTRLRLKEADQSEVSVNPGNARNYVENSKVSESLLRMKFYSLSCVAVSHLLFDDEVNLPMQVTDEQMDIILSGKSSFIIERSGTGKTTILTMKLFQHE
ncbi:hypothetical protein Tco_0312376, partial [Tanacetum coccineum]